MKRNMLPLLLMLFAVPIYTQEKADIIVYSFDRPLQLHAFLESSTNLIEGIGNCFVICRASNSEFKKGYDIVAKRFPSTTFYFQSSEPKKDFKKLTIHCFNEGKNPYVLFAVDDIIVTDNITLSDCIRAMQECNAYAFFFRLGKNITRSYRDENNQPNLSLLRDDIYSWYIKDGSVNWGYPNNLDMTLYRKSEIRNALISMYYETPNTFESTWSGKGHEVAHRLGLCCQRSKIVNIPLNMVQSDYPNLSMNFKTISDLLGLYFENKIIDIRQFFRIDNNAPHMDYEPHFISVNN